jgi:hypothetical protein
MQPYSPRAIRFHGLRGPTGWKLKLYSVAFDETPIDWTGFERGLGLAEAELPVPDAAAGRPGLGFLIAHQGRTGDYAVLGWWDNENELPLRVFVRRGKREDWRAARGGESVCVWDLEIIASERDAWVETMLSGQAVDPAAYLERVHGAARSE